MTKEELTNLFQEYAEAEKKYLSYVDQFFTTMWNGKITKEALKVLTHEELNKIEELNNKADDLKKQWEKEYENWASNL